MSQRDQFSYFTPAHYMFCESDGRWYTFGPMPLFKAVLLAVGKYRPNHEACVLGGAVNLIGINAILALRQRPDFPLTLTMETVEIKGFARAENDRSAANDKPTGTRSNPVHTLNKRTNVA